MGLRRRRNRTDDDLQYLHPVRNVGTSNQRIERYEADKKKNIEERAFSLQEDE